MARVGRWAVIAVLATAAAGCGFGGRPYADDPLLRAGRGVRGDPARTRSPDPGPPVVPLAPPPPLMRSDLIAHLGHAPAHEGGAGAGPAVPAAFEGTGGPTSR
jgi:hypothetical protein